MSIVVTYNGTQWCEQCLTSLRNSSILSRIIVVDNGSSDDTVKIIKEKFPEVHLIVSPENLGFAKANNVGIKYALKCGADYVFLLNQDAWIEKETVEKLYDAFKDNPDAGIVSPIHVNGSYSGLDENFTKYITQSISSNFVSDLYFGKLKTYYKSNFINAAAWLVSRTCIEKVGGFDDGLFFHYGEDYNYCQRVKFHNFGIYVSTQTAICHDRESRDNNKSRSINEYFKFIDEKIYFADLEINETFLEKEIIRTRRTHLKKTVKYIISLDVHELKVLNKYTRDKIKLLHKIKESRNIYQKGGLAWLT